MTVLQKIKSFFKRTKPTAKAEEPKPAARPAEEKASEATEKKAGEGGQQSTGTT